MSVRKKRHYFFFAVQEVKKHVREDSRAPFCSLLDMRRLGVRMKFAGNKNLSFSVLVVSELLEAFFFAGFSSCSCKGKETKERKKAIT